MKRKLNQVVDVVETSESKRQLIHLYRKVSMEYIKKIHVNKKEGDTEQKAFHNYQFVNKLVKLANKINGNFYIIYLDGIHARTSKILHEANFRKNQLIAVTNESPTIINKYATAYQMAFSMFLKVFPFDRRVIGVWYDSNSTFHGASNRINFSPAIDLLNILPKLQSQTLFAITLSLRKSRCKNHQEKLKKIISQYFDFTEIHYEQYLGPMLFYFMRFNSINLTTL